MKRIALERTLQQTFKAKGKYFRDSKYLLKFFSFCLHHRALRKVKNFLIWVSENYRKHIENKKKMTTNTKAITECSSCCWLIYCKYLFLATQNLNCCEEKREEIAFGFPGRRKTGPCPWGKKMFTIFLMWLIVESIVKKTFLSRCGHAMKMRRKTLSMIQSAVFFVNNWEILWRCGMHCYMSLPSYCSKKPRTGHHKEHNIHHGPQRSVRIFSGLVKCETKRRNNIDQRLPNDKERAWHSHASDPWPSSATSATCAQRTRVTTNL